MNTIRMKNYEITVNENNEVVDIMKQTPYQKVYPYKNIGGTLIKQDKVKLSTLRAGLRNGNWELF